MRPSLRRDSLHSRVLDAEFLGQERHLAAETVVLGLDPHAGVEVVLSMAPGDGEHDVRHRDGMDDRRANVSGPGLGE